MKKTFQVFSAVSFIVCLPGVMQSVGDDATFTEISKGDEGYSGSPRRGSSSSDSDLFLTDRVTRSRRSSPEPIKPAETPILRSQEPVTIAVQRDADQDAELSQEAIAKQLTHDENIRIDRANENSIQSLMSECDALANSLDATQNFALIERYKKGTISGQLAGLRHLKEANENELFEGQNLSKEIREKQARLIATLEKFRTALERAKLMDTILVHSKNTLDELETGLAPLKKQTNAAGKKLLKELQSHLQELGRLNPTDPDFEVHFTRIQIAVQRLESRLRNLINGLGEHQYAS